MLPAFFRARARKFVLRSCHSSHSYYVFTCCPPAVQMLFTFENAVPVKPRRLGVQCGLNAVRFLRKTDAKAGQNCFRLYSSTARQKKLPTQRGEAREKQKSTSGEVLFSCISPPK